MGLSRLLMMLSFKTLILSYFLGSNSIIVLLSDKNTTTKLHLTTAAAANPLSPPPPPPPPLLQIRSNMAPFKPTVAVVVGVLTTLFSVTFLLLLYAKHCKRENGYRDNFRGLSGALPPFTDRKNSGVDRTVIESLPIFRFGSLRGAAKDGLECAVCLNRFEPTEVLKLLPKCKHAFHVECVDTWLDAHSTCPLCRCRVDPEDILLLNDAVKVISQHEGLLPPPPLPLPSPAAEAERIRRVSGRHSSAGERGSCNNGGFLQIVEEKAGEKNNGGENVATRRSLDGWNLKSYTTTKKKTKDALGVGCFDRRKDGMLLTLDEERRSSDRRRLEHRIIVGSGGGEGGGGGGKLKFQHRWSDVQPSDLLYLRSEMLMSDSRGSRASGSRPSVQQQQQDIISSGGRSVINGRSVSEITGLSRLSNNYGHHHHHHRGRRRWEERESGGGGEREAGMVSRWLAWISSSHQSSHSSSSHQSQAQQTLPVVGS